MLPAKPVIPNPVNSFIGTVNALNAMKRGNVLTKNYPQEMANQLLQQQLANRTAQTNLNYLPGMDAARNQGMNLQNIGRNISNQYAPAMDTSKVNYQNAMTSVLPVEMQAKLKMADAMLNHYNSNYPATQAINTLTPQQKTLVAAENPAIQTSILNRGFGLPVLNPQQTQQFQNAQQMAVNKSLSSPQLIEQEQGAVPLNNLMNSQLFSTGSKAWAQYSGLVGKGQKSLDAWRNSNPQTYNAAMSFQHVMIPAIENRLRQVEGMHATDQQKKQLHDIVSKIQESWSGNPARTMNYINQFKNTADQIEQGVSQAAQPVFHGAYQRAIAGGNQQNSNEIPASNNQWGPLDKNGIPKQFASKAKAYEWMHQATPSEIATIRQRMGK